MADASSLMSEVMQATPSVLVLSSHGETHGVWLADGLVEGKDIVEALAAINRELRPEQRIRLLVINTCMSGPLAEALSAYVDFVIGHGMLEVGDEEAIRFAVTLFRALGRGFSLDASFKAAKLASSPFKLYAQRFDPAGFFLPVPSGEAQAGQQPAHVPADKAASAAAPEFPVVAFLKEHGLSRIAQRLSDELSLEHVSDLKYVNAEKLGRLDWLVDVPREKLLDLCRCVVADSLSPSEDERRSQAATTPATPDISDFSESDTLPSDSGSDHEGGDEIVFAARNVGNKDELVAHLKMFIHGLMGDSPLDDGHGQWSYCMLLWMVFLKDARYAPPHEKRMERWLKGLCEGRGIREHDMAQQVHACAEAEVASHLLWGQIREKMAGFASRPCVASVAIIDHMVQHLLRGRPYELEMWRVEVIGKWYVSAGESAADVLQRANGFLQSSVDAISLLLQGIETTSYVVFLRMSRLAAAVLCGYLEARRLELAHAAAEEGAPPALQGFTAFASSAGHVFSLRLADRPAHGAVAVEGLRCLARQGAAAFEGLAPNIKTARGLVDLESEGSRARKPATVPEFRVEDHKPLPPDDASSAAASGATTVASASLAASTTASATGTAQPSRQISPRQEQALRQLLGPLVSKQPVGAGLERELVDVLEEWDLMDAADALLAHGHKSMKRLRKMQDTDVDEMKLPTGTARELKELLVAMKGEESPAGRKEADGKPVDVVTERGRAARTGDDLGSHSLENQHDIGSIVREMSKQMQDAELQAQGCRALRKLACKNDANRVAIAEPGGIRAILGAMQGHGGHAGVQDQGCGALRILAINDANRVAIAEQGGIRAILGAMQGHGSSEELRVER